MKGKLFREAIARVGPKGIETGGPEGPIEAGKEAVGAVDAYRRGDRETFERRLRAVATYGALRVLDRRVAGDGAESESGIGIESPSADAPPAEAADRSESGSGLLTLPRLALAGIVATVGYALVRRYRSDEPLSKGDALLGGEGDEGVDGADVGDSDRTAAADVGVDTPSVTSEAVRDDGAAGSGGIGDSDDDADDEPGSDEVETDEADDGDSAENGTGGDEDDDPDDTDIRGEVETTDEISDEDADPGEIVAEEEVVEEAADGEPTAEVVAEGGATEETVDGEPSAEIVDEAEGGEDEASEGDSRESGESGSEGEDEDGEFVESDDEEPATD